MKTFKTVDEIKGAVIGDTLTVFGDVNFLCDFSIEANLYISGNIYARNINARSIKAWSIDAGDIKAWSIDAGDIKAWNIKAWSIDAGNISYYAFCLAYYTMRCYSHKGRRKNAKAICLDTDIEITSDNETA